tara:strand:- start:4528 stop:4947 length:420 start_codon:yes stop_codon:yes gene_type:complete
MDYKTKYSEKLKNPKWQKKRLEILNRDDWACRHCKATEKTLHVHHLNYKYGNDPWDYHDGWLLTLCVDCHEHESKHSKPALKLLECFVKLRLNVSQITELTLVLSDDSMFKNSLLPLLKRAMQGELKDTGTEDRRLRRE